MPELSIIVPVYKVEKYLPRCIDSILAQTFRDFELILIDDGSPDNCGAICDAYATRDSRIRVIHQENAGVSAARNAGLDIATGTYLGFVDSDDWIEPEMYETMIATAKNHKVDVVICGFEYFDHENNLIVDNGRMTEVTTMASKQLLLRSFGLIQRMYYGAVWNKLFRAPIFCNRRFRVGVAQFEDWLMILEILELVQSGALIPDAFYHYSTDSEFSSGKSLSSNKIFTSMSIFYGTLYQYNNDSEVYSRAIERYLDDSVIYLKRIKGSKRAAFVSLCLKWRMLKLLGKAKVKNLLPAHMINRYLYEGVLRG